MPPRAKVSLATRSHATTPSLNVFHYRHQRPPVNVTAYATRTSTTTIILYPKIGHPHDRLETTTKLPEPNQRLTRS